MKTHTTPYGAATTASHYLANYASALVAYAKHNSSFHNTLLRAIAELSISTNVVADHGYISDILSVPSSEGSAEGRLAWLTHELRVRDESETKGALSVLEAYASEYEKPKSVVIGIVGLAIIGPTLGIVKKHKSQTRLTVVMSDRYEKADRDVISSLALKVGNGIVSDALLELHGDATRLEPDLATWFFEDKVTDTLFVPGKELEKVKNELLARSLPHKSATDEIGISAIAISPAVNLSTLGIEA